jgi:4-hydroxy-tetrahydrodipicolinate synthase
MTHKEKQHVKALYNKRARRNPEALIAALLQEMFTNTSQRVIIAVGGPGGIGKSTFTEKLAKHLDNSQILHLDDYKTPRAERQGKNLFGAHPNANYMDTISEHLVSIRNGIGFQQPVYDAVAGTASKTRLYEPTRFNLLDGEISTYPHFRSAVDLSIFIDSDWTTQLKTRLNRDIDERGYTKDKAIATFLHSNLREFAEHGADSKSWADIHLFCDADYRLRIESISESIFNKHQSLLKTDLGEVDITGLVVPVLTPFTEEDEVDEAALAAHLDFLANAGVRRILVNGTTGEFFSLTPEERKLTIALACQYFPGVVMCHCGHTAIKQTISEAQTAETYGADAIVALPPYYYAEAPTNGMIDYFTALHNAIETPLFLYNFPKHTGNSLTAELISQIPHSGMKDSSGNIDLIPHTSKYFSAGPLSPVDGYHAGACGFVSSEANFLPELFVKLENAFNAQANEAAKHVFDQITSIQNDLPSMSATAKCKAGLSLRLPNYPARVRPPLSTAAQESYETFTKLLQKHQIIPGHE